MALTHPAAVLAIILCAVLAFAHGQKWPRGQHTCSGYVSNPKEDHVFVFQEEDHCPTEALSDRWEEEIGRSQCRLHKVMVVLNTDGVHEFHPPMVEAERCVGNCQDTLSCQPKDWTKRQVQVTRKNTLTRETMCGQVEVIEHKECECMESK